MHPSDVAAQLAACKSLAWAIKELAPTDTPILGLAEHLWDLLSVLHEDADDRAPEADEVRQ